MMQMNDELQAVMQEDDQNSLEHYGVKGQKWGQRNYQNPDGTYTELGKERRRVAFIREEKQKEKDANAHQNGIEESIDTGEDTKIGGKAYKDMTRKELRAAKKRARHNEKERKERREFNRDKREAIENGDISFISKNINKFTNDEIDEAMIRFNKMQNLKNLENANRKDATYFMDKAAKFLNSAEKVVTPITNISNKLNEASKKASEKRSQLISENKNMTELSYLQNPKLKPLTKAEELKNKKEALGIEKQEIDNAKARDERKQTELDTTWKDFTTIEKRKDYDLLSVADFKNKWGSYDSSGGGKGKGGGDNSGGKKNDNKSEEKKDKFRDKAISKGITDEDTINDLYNELIGSKSKKSSIGNWFSKKNKEDVKGTDFDLDDKRTNAITKKYTGQLKMTEKDYFNEPSVRNNEWKKDLKSHDADVIDKWVKDMKKKYMKERKMSSKEAEKKAEEYVDAWLDAYDEGNIN